MCKTAAHLLTDRNRLKVESKQVWHLRGIVARAVLSIDLVDDGLHMQLIVSPGCSDVLGKVNTQTIGDGCGWNACLNVTTLA